MNWPPPTKRPSGACEIYLFPSLLAVACLSANFFLRGTVVSAIATLSLLASTLLLGLPHGAGDKRGIEPARRAETFALFAFAFCLPPSIFCLL